MNDKKWTAWHTTGLFIIAVVIVLIGYQVCERAGSWLGILMLLTISAALIGQGTVGLWRGLLIDDRNKMRLSRPQMIRWTVLVLSGFFVAGLSNVRNGQDNHLSIAIPAELWMLMGISTTSLVGSPLILNDRKTNPVKDDEKKRTFALMEGQGIKTKETLDNLGQIVVKNAPNDAQISELFI